MFQQKKKEKNWHSTISLEAKKNHGRTDVSSEGSLGNEADGFFSNAVNHVCTDNKQSRYV